MSRMQRTSPYRESWATLSESSQYLMMASSSRTSPFQRKNRSMALSRSRSFRCWSSRGLKERLKTGRSLCSSLIREAKVEASMAPSRLMVMTMSKGRVLIRRRASSPVEARVMKGGKLRFSSRYSPSSSSVRRPPSSRVKASYMLATRRISWTRWGMSWSNPANRILACPVVELRIFSDMKPR